MVTIKREDFNGRYETYLQTVICKRRYNSCRTRGVNSIGNSNCWQLEIADVLCCDFGGLAEIAEKSFKVNSHEP